MPTEARPVMARLTGKGSAIVSGLAEWGCGVGEVKTGTLRTGVTAAKPIGSPVLHACGHVHPEGRRCAGLLEIALGV
jgi:hypothetical protein